MSDVLWRRLRYMLSPQMDLYASLARRVSGRSVLEVGFGTGAGTLQLVPHARNVTAIESDPEAVAFVRQMWPYQADWQQSDILDYRPGEVFEAVIMVEVLEHIKDYNRALDNVVSCLVRGGKLYMTARNRNADLRRNELHEREWTAQELSDALGRHFTRVSLWDYTLERELFTDTHSTPLIAVAERPT